LTQSSPKLTDISASFFYSVHIFYLPAEIFDVKTALCADAPGSFVLGKKVLRESDKKSTGISLFSVH